MIGRLATIIELSMSVVGPRVVGVIAARAVIVDLG